MYLSTRNPSRWSYSQPMDQSHPTFDVFFGGAAKVSTGAIVEEVARVGERLCYRHFLSACPVSHSCLFLILFGYCNSVWNQFNPIQFNSNL
jgi:hypothetical protein